MNLKVKITSYQHLSPHKTIIIKVMWHGHSSKVFKASFFFIAPILSAVNNSLLF